MQQSTLTLLQLEPDDHRLVKAARAALCINYRMQRHTVGAAVLCSSGRMYTGIGVEECLYGPCAEPRAMTVAFAQGDRDIRSIVAVCKRGDEYPIVAPCRDCCQLLVDHAPDAMVILSCDGKTLKTRVRDLLHGARKSDPSDVCGV